MPPTRKCSELVKQRLQAYGLAQTGNRRRSSPHAEAAPGFPHCSRSNRFYPVEDHRLRPAQRAGVSLPGPGRVARPSAGAAWEAGVVIRRAGAAWPAGLRPDPGFPQGLHRPGLPVRGSVLPGGLEVQLARATGWRITRPRPSGRRCCGNTISSSITSTLWPCTNTWPCAFRATITNGISAGGFTCSCAALDPAHPERGAYRDRPSRSAVEQLSALLEGK